MVFKDALECERSIRSLRERLKDKPKGYVTELNINGYTFSQWKSPAIEIVLLDPNQPLIAYRPKAVNNAGENNEKWSFGDYQRAVKDAFSWINQVERQKGQRAKNLKENKDSDNPEYTLMGLF